MQLMTKLINPKNDLLKIKIVLLRTQIHIHSESKTDESRIFFYSCFQSKIKPKCYREF